MAIYGIRGLAACAVIYMAFSMLAAVWDVYTLGDEMGKLEETQLSKQQEMDALKSRSKYSTQQLERINGSVELVEKLGKEAYSPDWSLTQVSLGMAGKPGTEQVIWELKEKAPAAAGAAPVPGAAAGPTAETRLTLGFAPDILADRKRLQQETTDILNQLKAKLTGFTVSYKELPSLLTDSERIDMELTREGADGKPKKAEKTKATLSITGPVMGGSNGNAQVPNP